MKLPVIVLALTTFLVASGRAPGALRVAVSDEPGSLNPLLVQNPTESEVAGLIFSGLLRRSVDGALQPSLATNVPSKANREISADGKSFTFHLRRDVRWHDGAPFDAADVLFTYAAMRNPKLDVAGNMSDFVTASAPDRWTVIVKFKRPHADVLGDFFAAPLILPKHLLAGVPDLNRAAFNEHPIGTGPYVFMGWQRGESIELRANGHYFGERPAISRVRFVFVASTTTAALMLKTGEVDFSALEPAGVALLRGSSVHIVKFRRHSLQYVAFNTTRAPLDDPRVRRALSLAVDKKQFITTIYHGDAVAADGLVPPYDWAYAPTGAPPSNIAVARRLLDAAGWRLRGDGSRERNGQALEIGLLYLSERQTFRTLAVQLQERWGRIGVRVSLRPLSVLGFTARSGPLRTGSYDALLESFGFPSSSPDRSFMLDVSAEVPTGYNDARYSNSEVQRLDDEGEATYDPARRKALSALIERRVARDVPYIPIAWADTIVGYTDTLRSVVIPTESSVFSFLSKWKLNAPQ